MSRRSKRIWGIIVGSSAAIAVSVSLLVAGSYALFTDEITVKNHLRAGKLEAKLERVGLTATTFTQEGCMQNVILQEEGVDVAVDFTYKTEENIFGFLETDKIAPTCERTAIMQLKNNGDVRYSYWVEVYLPNGKTATAADKELSKQLEITVITKTATITKRLADGLSVGSETEPLGGVAIGATERFSVSITFLSDVDYIGEMNNNAAQGGTVQFDFVVHVVQAV